jgi:small basic protein
MVLPIPKVAIPMKFSDYRPIRLLACLSKVFEVLMARVDGNELLTVFQSSLRPHQFIIALRWLY